MLHLEYLMMAHDQERVKKAMWHVKVAESRRMQREANQKKVRAFLHRVTGLLGSSEASAAWATSRARLYQEGAERRRHELVNRLRRSANPCKSAS